MGLPVAFAGDSVGESAQQAVGHVHDGGILLLENVRFHPEEERNDPPFARRLAQLGDLYVNDAFATAHRAHASTEGVAHLLPHAAGFLMEAELRSLSRLADDPVKPFVCAIGGAKIKDKIAMLERLSELVDAFCIGGGMANTLLAARGVNVGRSLRDDDLDPAKHILELTQQRGVALHLPTDAVVAPSFDAEDRAHVVAIDAVGDEMILDIGPADGRAVRRRHRKARRRSSSTGRWASTRSRPTGRARRSSAKRSRRRRRPARPASSAAATPLRRRTCSASRRR